jgi:hypothetical protein
MKDRIKQSIKIDWQKIKPLQPENVKLPYNTAHLKKSLLKYGFSLPFYVWESEGEYYCIDGHHRLDVLNELIAEGHKVPKELNAVEIEAKDRKEAISILVDVMNQRSNPFAEEYLIEFLEVENIDIQEVNIESVNVVSEDLVKDSDDFNTDFSLPDGDKAPFQQMTFTLADEQADQIKNAIADIKETQEYKYAETMGNENSNGNALYLIIMQWAEQKK